jgi:hypothetical protein
MDSGEKRISWFIHACFVAIAGMTIFVLGPLSFGAGEGLAPILVKLELIGFSVFALLSCLLFLTPFAHQSALGYVVTQAGAAVLSAVVLILMVLGGVAREL